MEFNDFIEKQENFKKKHFNGKNMKFYVYLNEYTKSIMEEIKEDYGIEPDYEDDEPEQEDYEDDPDESYDEEDNSDEEDEYYDTEEDYDEDQPEQEEDDDFERKPRNFNRPKSYNDKIQPVIRSKGRPPKSDNPKPKPKPVEVVKKPVITEEDIDNGNF